MNESDLVDAIGQVIDPEIRLPLADLHMLRWAKVRRSRVDIQIDIPVPEHPAQLELENRIRQAVRNAGVDGDVNVRTEIMDASERAVLRAALASDNEDGHGQESLPFADKTSHTRVIGISSGKGGVGKSSITVNLALSLARMGKSVAILDADVYGFSVPKMLGVDHDPMVIDDIMIPPIAHGVACLSMGLFVEDSQPLIWRGPMLHKALQQFLSDAHWGRPDYLVIDMPPGTGDVALSMAEYLPRTEIVVVTTPQPAAQRVAQRSAIAARKMKLTVRGVVENMSWFTGDDRKRYEIFGSGGGQDLAHSLGVELLAQVPLVSALRSGGDSGVPVVASDPGSEASQAFERLAQRIDDMGPARVYRKELTIR